MDSVTLRGARTNNLKGVDLNLRPGELVVVTGVSGAGKSSLAMHTLYAEGQRRYVESFSAYARQFLERLPRPPVEQLEPVPPAIAVDRQGAIKTSRSTVGSLTELNDYVKLLFAHAADPMCATCGTLIAAERPVTVAARLLTEWPGRAVMVLYSVMVEDAEHYLALRERLVSDGYRRVVADGALFDLDELSPTRALEAAATARGAAQLWVVVDRLTVDAAAEARLVEALETAFQRGSGHARVQTREGELRDFSELPCCRSCGATAPRMSPALFSWSSPLGACSDCKGFGSQLELDMDKVVPDPRVSLAEGAIRPWTAKAASRERSRLRAYCSAHAIPMDVPFRELSAEQRALVLEGDHKAKPKWYGVRGWFRWLESKMYKMHVRVFFARYRRQVPCATCGGTRFRPEALLWRLPLRRDGGDGVGPLNVGEFLALPASSALDVVCRLREQAVVSPSLASVLDEIVLRLRTLCDVGLGHLALDRVARTLSGGEGQRVALATALATALSDALFVLDEPSVGLHASEVERLVDVVKRVAEAGNTVVVVDHERAFMERADRVIELGPGSGEQGGQLVFDGQPAAFWGADTPTARSLRSPVAAYEARPHATWLRLTGANGRNLKNVDLELPCRAITCITGVSGSGKSSLIVDTLAPAVAAFLDVPGGLVDARAGDDAATQPDAALPSRGLPYATLEFHHRDGDRATRRRSGIIVRPFSACIVVDQSPLGRTSRATPATYLAAWDAIRERFAREPLARQRGYKAGMFSFNVPGGRCEACQGEGAETVEMHFFADISLPCEMCGGRRYQGEVLDVHVDGRSIADVFELTVDAAVEVFENDAVQTRGAQRERASYTASERVVRALRPLQQFGLGYLRLGQPLSTLSGGEAQRLKLCRAFSEVIQPTLFVLDEPSAGLHPDEVASLMKALRAQVEADVGHTVVVVDHDLRVAAEADYLVELGPGAGAAGGTVVGSGAPGDFVDQFETPTALALRAEVHTASGTNGTAQTSKRARTARIADSAKGTYRRGASEAPINTQAVQIEHATEHNLRDVSVAVPKSQFVVVTGPSGSGKSTLAFDVLCSEGRRRYMETLSPYVRQYLPQLPRAAVRRVRGVPPTVALEQRISRAGGTSTVATITEVGHYLRLLYARLGRGYCPDHGLAITEVSPEALAQELVDALPKGGVIAAEAEFAGGKRGEFTEVIARLVEHGIKRATIDGSDVALREGMKLSKRKQHEIRVTFGSVKPRLEDLRSMIEQARALGAISVSVGGRRCALHHACPECGFSLPELEPRLLSFNTKYGACPECEGRGVVEKSVGRGRNSMLVYAECDACGGTRLSRAARSVKLDGRSIDRWFELTVESALHDVEKLAFQGRQAAIAEPILQELVTRLRFLNTVGVGYLGLDRPAESLSGGEFQRVRLAAQLGSGLTGVLYVLDEPTIGLHTRDTARLLQAIRMLADRHCSVVVVEHDTDTIAAADYVIDMGPGGGHHGGRLIAQGTPRQVAKNPESATGRALSRTLEPGRRRPIVRSSRWLKLGGAREHNLRGVDVALPVGRLVAVTGVSGSGKSTLVRDVLLRAVRDELGLLNDEPAGDYRDLKGADAFVRAVEVDQSPIGRTSRSVPVTYLGLWDPIRKLFASLPEAKTRGYTAKRFSFNTAEGRCPTCEGQGRVRLEMAFLPDATIVCETCEGRRFDDATLAVRWRGRTIAEILELEIEEAAELFQHFPSIAIPLQRMTQLGLGYLRLGQPSSTLSGGEAQRLKLVSELGSPTGKPTLYVLDEPSTGLHREDVAKLRHLIDALVDRGDTVILIEHQLDLIYAADYIIDLGPEGGSAGGQVVVCGTPDEILRHPTSYTAVALREALAPRAHKQPNNTVARGELAAAP